MAKDKYEVQDLELNVYSQENTSADDATRGSSQAPEKLNGGGMAVLNRLAKKLRAETKGIEPVTEDEKDDSSIWNAAFVWFSANMVIAAFSVGMLGPLVFSLNFWGCVVSIVIFTFIGVLPVCLYSVFGVQLSLRQMVLSRFLLGNVTARIFALINVIACIGWGVVNTVTSAQLLHMINPTGGRCPPWAGCLIIVFSTIFVTFFGYRVIHTFGKYSWIPNFIVFIVIIARLKIDGSFSVGKWESGSTTAGSILSLGGIVFGFATGWTTYAADFTVYMPRTVNRAEVFFAVMLGLVFPLCFTIILGAAAGCAALNNPVYHEFYESDHAGGLVYAILVPRSLHGFGQFCCVLLAMSTVANMVPNMYSIALGTQALWEPLAKVPRVFWTLAGNLITLAIAIPAYYRFEAFMTNFMDSIAYYLSIYIGVSLSEHFIFRQNKFSNYDTSEWNDWHRLPLGYAGCAALFVGAIGVALGMHQTYWTGEIGRLIGEFGGDIGFELGLAFSMIVYTALRPLEIKFVGR